MEQPLQDILSKNKQEDMCFYVYTVLFFFLLLLLFIAMACGILVSQPGIKPRQQQWKCWVLTTGPPGNSLYLTLLSYKQMEREINNFQEEIKGGWIKN